MTTFRPLYGTTAQAITITLASLASSATAGRQSTVIDNRTNLYNDVMLQGTFQIPTGGSAGSDFGIYIYVFGTANDSSFGAERPVAGTQATLGATDAAYSMAAATVGLSPPLIQVKFVAVPVAPTSTAGVYTFAPIAIAQFFGGRLPAQWGVFVRNFSGQTLDSSGSSLFYQGIQDQGV